MRGLTKKQERFCVEYVANNQNGTQAAISAGYAETSAYSIASDNLKKHKVRQRIDELSKPLIDEAILSAKELRKILANIILGKEEEFTVIDEESKRSGKLHREVTNRTKNSDRITAAALYAKLQEYDKPKDFTDSDVASDLYANLVGKKVKGVDDES